LINLRYYISQLKAEVNYFPTNLSYFFSRKKRAIYIGCTGQGNLGDEAILKAISLMLNKDFFLYKISYTKPSSGKYLRKLFVKNPDYIILGGGTIIRKKANESYLKIVNTSIKSWPNAKLVTLGPGVSEPSFAEYIGFPLDVEGWKTLLNKNSFISVRGVCSKRLLDRWQLNKKVNILHDPAIWFTREKFNLKTKQKRIGLNFADIGNRIYGKNQDLIKSFALNLVSKLQNYGWTIFLYPTTKSDMDFMLNNIGLKNIQGLRKYNNYKNINHSLEFLQSLDVFVGQRLHSVIFSATVSTPFFALEYEPKTKDFIETIDMLGYSEQVDRLVVETIVSKIEKMYSNIDAEQSKLNSKMLMAKCEQKICLNKFLNTL
tara:strand:+ start:3632 stop:4753 length:1122 start_codon:yes stop_codon:yes gene_type:complete